MTIWNKEPDSLRFLPYLKFGQVFTNVMISQRHVAADGKTRLAYYKSDFMPIPAKFREKIVKCIEGIEWLINNKNLLDKSINQSKLDSLTKQEKKADDNERSNKAKEII